MAENARISVLGLRFSDQNTMFRTFGMSSFQSNYQPYYSFLNTLGTDWDKPENLRTTFKDVCKLLDLNRRSDEDNFSYDEEDDDSDGEILTDQDYEDYEKLKAKYADTTDKMEALQKLQNVQNLFEDPQEQDRVVNLLQNYHQVEQAPDNQRAGLENKFAFIYSLSQSYNALRDPEDITRTMITQKNDQLMMLVKNLNGTGLNFTIDDNKSLVMNNNSITEAQARELSRFMFQICDLKNINDFDLSRIRDLQVVGEDLNGSPTSRPFGEALEQGLMEERQQENNQRPWEREEFERWMEENHIPSDVEAKKREIEEKRARGEKVDEEVNKGPGLSMRAFRAKIIDRMHIAGYTDRRLIDVRPNWDGGFTFCVYTDDANMRHDEETNKGDIKRTKVFACRIRYKKGVPTISYYVPQGKLIEGGQARIMLEGLKSQGCEFAIIPNALMTAGKGQGAFWEAVAKSRVCPMGKPLGNELKPQNIIDIMETLKKENDPSRAEVLHFKANLLGVLEEQEEHFRKGNPNHVINNKMAAEMDKLRGAINYEDFNANGLLHIQQFIGDMVNTDKVGLEKRWNQVETLAAYEALNVITENYLLLRKKYDGQNLSDAQLKYEMVVIMQEGLLDKNGQPMLNPEGRPITPTGTMRRTQREVDQLKKTMHRNSEDRNYEDALKQQRNAVANRMNDICSRIESDYDIKLANDRLSRYSSAAVAKSGDHNRNNVRHMITRNQSAVSLR